MIEVEHLTRYYGQKAAIQDVTFRVEKGEILGFLGPNAAGKTTTMRILTCYMPATSGTARVAGFDVFQDSIEVRKRIGYLPENPPLYPEMTVESFLDFVSKIKGIDPRDRKRKIERVMDICDIADVKDAVIGKLSRGYKQRVGLAQALVHDPEVLILDEPTIGLDPKQIIEVRKLIKEMGGRHTIILSTHILPEVSMTCNRVVIINEGRVVAEDTPENLTAKLKGSERLFLHVEGPAEEMEKTIKALDGVTKISREKGDRQRSTFIIESRLGMDVRKNLARTIVENGWGLLELKPIGMSLEEVFLRLTTHEEVIDL